MDLIRVGVGAGRLLPPVIKSLRGRLITIALTFIIVWLLTDWLVPWLAGNPGSAGLRRRAKIIGKCENVLIVIFVLAGQPVGLALIFTAKTVARQNDIRRNAGYYLGGTILNFTISFVLATIARVLMAGM